MVIAALAVAASLIHPARAGEMPAFDQLRALAPAADRQGPQSAPVSALDAVSDEGAAPDRFISASALGAPAASVPLDRIVNNLWQSKTTFPAGDRLVHVFGVKAQNNNARSGWYVGFYVEGAAQPALVDGAKIAHLSVFTHPHEQLQFNGLKYDVHLDIPLLDHDPNSIKLTVQSLEKGGSRYQFTLTEISAGVYAVGYPLKLGSQEYRVIFAQDFLDNRGKFGGYTQDMSIALMFKDGGQYSGFHRFKHDIPDDGRALIATPRKVLSAGDGWSSSGLTLGLRIKDGHLDVFYPVPETLAAPLASTTAR